MSFLFFMIWLTPCALLAQWVARKLSKWTCADSDILCRAPVFFLSPEKIRFRHLQSSANISNPQTKICSLIARKTYTRKVNITARPDISGWPFRTPWKSAIFLLKPTFKEFRSWRMSFNSISVNLKEKYALRNFFYKLCIYLGLFGSSNSYTTFPFMSGSAVAHLHQRNVDS